MASPINPKVLEHAKKLVGEQCELVKATEWSYHFKCGEKSFCRISRFLAEEGFAVDASVLRDRWPLMNHAERLDFAGNFSAKEQWTENDTEILDIIMADGDDVIWAMCALAMLRHPDRDRVIAFLTERVRTSISSFALNCVQALGLSEDRRAVPVIRARYYQLVAELERESVIGVPDDIFRGPIPYHAFFCVAGALFKIERSPEYEQAIRQFFDHPNEQVRWWAEHALEVDGPTTAKRNQEYRMRHSSPK